jgi:respiratory burst oxidase
VAAAPPLDGASFGANARSFAALCSTSTSITGFVMLATLLAGTPFAMKYPRSWAVVKRSRVGRALNNYTAFWNTHVVMAVVFFGLILVHPLPGLPSASPGGPSVAWVLLSLPILLYLGSAAATLRRRRAAPPARVVDAELHPGGVLALRLERPALGAGAVAGAGPMQFRAGQYVRLACPELSRLEWHPFTISSAPSDPGLTLHIKALGDWTGELHARFRAVIEARGGGGGGGAQSDAPGKSDEGDGEGGADPARWPTIWVDGPWGSPVQAFEEFPVLVLVAAGIGVTPMASVLAELLRRAEGAEGAGALSARKVYFRWLVS